MDEKMDEIGRILTDINNKNHFDNLSKIVENANMIDLLKNPIVKTLFEQFDELQKERDVANLEIAKLKKYINESSGINEHS